MNNNKTKSNNKPYIDIPLSPDDTPLHLVEKLSSYNIPKEPIEIGLDFITRLDESIRDKNSQGLYSLYVNYFEIANNSHFVDKVWPKTYEIEKSQEEGELSAKVQTVYNQLRLRNLFDKIKNLKNEEFFEIAEDAWDSYSSIFQRQYKEISFPSIIVWDILENFLYELTQYHTILPTIEDKSNMQDFVFEINESKKMLKKIVNNITTENDDKHATTKDIFGYYGIVILASLQILENNYKEALQTLSRISLNDLSFYSKSIGALLTLFLSASYSYFMLEQYKESARVAEMVLLFYQKNKKYFSGVNGERIITRLFQKLASLLCIDYIFLQEKPKTLMMQIFKITTIKVKDKQYRQKLSDKYTKMRQNDIGTFIKLFQLCSLPCLPKYNEEIQEKVLARFKALQKITLNSIVQHYTQISLTKIAKMLNIDENEVLKRLQSFNSVSTGNNSKWDLTILQPLLSITHKLRVEMNEGVVHFEGEETNPESNGQWEQYKNQISWLVEKVNAL